MGVCKREQQLCGSQTWGRCPCATRGVRSGESEATPRGPYATQQDDSARVSIVDPCVGQSGQPQTSALPKPETHESPSGQSSSAWQRIRQPCKPPMSPAHDAATGPSTSGQGSTAQSGTHTLHPSESTQGAASIPNGHILPAVQLPYGPSGSIVAKAVVLELPSGSVDPLELEPAASVLVPTGEVSTDDVDSD